VCSSRRDPRCRFFSTPPHGSHHLRALHSSSPISTRLLSCCSRSSLSLSRLSCTSHFQARHASPSLSEICPRRFPIRHPPRPESLYLRRLLDLLDSSCRTVLSASLLQHHHIGATHSLLATISTTNYSPREHHSPSAASRLSQAHRRVFPGPLS
jgi:hypothetical protein